MQKINTLLSDWHYGTVRLTSWLVRNGFSNQLINQYKKSKWIDSVGVGALIRFGDHIEYVGAIYALQKQLGLSVHPGGKTALSILGKSHYLEFSAKKVTLFGEKGEKLPSWFRDHNWNVGLDYYSSSFLPPDIGFIEVEFKTFNIKISNSARAIMECLYLSPGNQDLLECYELMEGLNDLRPKIVQQLLESCRSVKVKRLFLHMAEKANHDWFNYLDFKKLNLGNGKRSIVKNGVYIPKYQITVSREMEKYEKTVI